jgi:hypothetical protein
MSQDTVRQQIIQLLPDFGFVAEEPKWQTWAISDGKYLGRRFEFESVRAFWLHARNVVEFYDLDGRLLGERPVEPLASVA